MKKKKLFMEYFTTKDNFTKVDDKTPATGGKTHGRDASKTIASLANGVHIYSANSSNLTIEHNYFSVVNGMANDGVRIISRSYTNGSTFTVNGDLAAYAPAILYRNVLFVNAAGNNNKHYTSNNFLPKDSLLRRGWITVAGYEEVKYVIGANGNVEHGNDKSRPENLKEYIGSVDRYYINGKGEYKLDGSGNKIQRKDAKGNLMWTMDDKQNKIPVYEAEGDNVFLISNYCGAGKADCVTAPFYINNGGSWSFGGTSAGTPMVSAVAATILSKYDWMSNQNIKDSIMTTAQKVYDKQTGKYQEEIDEKWGWGILDATKAMNGPGKFYEHDFEADVTVFRDERDYSYLSEFSNDISGEKGLVKKGNGWLALTGKNTYTGDTKVEAGGLWVTKSMASNIHIGDKGTLRGSTATFKDIDNKGAFFADGNNTVENYTQSAGAELMTNFGNTLTVNDKANIAGTLNFVGYVDKTSTTTTVLTAKTLSGTFSEVKSTSPLITLSGTTNYNDNKVTVTATRVSATDVSDKAFLTGAKNMDKIFQVTDKVFKANITDEDIKKLTDYELVGGQRVEDLTQGGVDNARYPYKKPTSDKVQYFNAYNEAKGIFALGAAELSEAVYSQNASVYANSLLTQSMFISGQSDFINNSLSNGGVFAEFIASDASFNHIVNMRSKNLGLNLGISKRYDNGFYVGVGALYVNTNYKEKYFSIEDSNNQNTYLGQFALGFSKNLILQSFITAGATMNNVNRTIKTNNNYSTNGKDFTNYILQVGAKLGYKISFGKYFYLTPYGEYKNETIMLKGFAEQSLSNFALVLNDTVFNEHLAKVGLDFGIGGTTLGVKGGFAGTTTIGGSHNLNIKARYISDNNGNVTPIISNTTFSKWRFDANAKVYMRFVENLEFTLGYQAIFFNSFLSNGVDAKIAYTF